jgi:hypothetical protein
MTFWKPMCEWMTISEQRTASMTGFRDPAAKGVTVSGTRERAIKRSIVQW